MVIIEQQREFLSATWEISLTVLYHFWMSWFISIKGNSSLSFYLFHKETQNLKLKNSRILQRELSPSFCFIFENTNLNTINVSSGSTFKISFLFPCGTCKRHSRTQYKLNCPAHLHQPTIHSLSFRCHFVYAGRIWGRGEPHPPTLTQAEWSQGIW